MLNSRWALPVAQTRSAALPYEPTMGTIRRHPAVLAAELAVTAPVVALLLFVIASAWHGIAPSVPAAVPALLVIAVWLYVAWLRWVSAELTLTEQRVVLRKGVLSQVERTIPFKRIQFVGLRQSLLGRLLGYGTVEIGVAGYADPHLFEDAPVRVARDRLLIPFA